MFVYKVSCHFRPEPNEQFVHAISYNSGTIACTSFLLKRNKRKLYEVYWTQEEENKLKMFSYDPIGRLDIDSFDESDKAN